MSGNASRYSHQPGRRYSQLVLPQSAMVTDADQREGMAIQLRNTTNLGDTAIRTGVPRTGGVLAVTVHDSPSAHRHATALRPGKVVAEGHVAELRLEGSAPLTHPAGLDLLHRQADLAGLAAFTDTAGAYALYADLLHLHVGPAVDGRLVDPAFLSAETSTRTEALAQLKIARLTGAPATDAVYRARIETGLPPHGEFRLTAAAFETEVVAPDICDPCATALADPHLDAGNHLFRLEVHASPLNRPVLDATPVRPRPPAAMKLVLKWSRDNGSVELPAGQAAALLADNAFDTAVFELADPVAEQRIGLWTEPMTERRASLHNRATVEAALAAAPAGAFLRVWDGAAEIDLGVAALAPVPVGTRSLSGTIAQAGGRWHLHLVLGGLALDLETAALAGAPFVLPGDAWSVEIREYANEAGDKLIWRPEPVETTHHYAYLGVIQANALRNAEMPDLRARAFPALTELEALDIAYDNARSGEPAVTVQGALDLLFARPVGGGGDCQCTLLVDPDRPLAEQLDELRKQLQEQPDLNALVCLPAGFWTLERSILLEGTGNLVLRGAGRGVSLIEAAAELRDRTGLLGFLGFASVRIEALGIDAMLKIGDKAAPQQLLAMLGIGRVSAERLDLRLRTTAPTFAQAIMVAPQKGIEGRPEIGLHDCLFRLDEGGCGLAVLEEGRLLRVEGCEFRADELQSYGLKDRFRLAGRLAAQVGAVRRTPAREARIAEGLYAPYPGNAELLLDLGAVAPAERPAAAGFWQAALPLVAVGEAPRGLDSFAEVRQSVMQLNEASQVLAEAEMTAILAQTGGTPALNGRGGLRDLARQGDYPALTALLTPRGESRITPVRGLGTGQVKAILDAGGGTSHPVDGPEPPPRQPDIPDLPSHGLPPPRPAQLLLDARNRLVRGRGLEDFVGAVGPALRDEPEAAPQGLPTTGVLVWTYRTLPIWIEGNAFFDIDTAIDQFARNTPGKQFCTPSPARSVIRANSILRRFLDQPVKAPPFDNFADAAELPRSPITLGGCDDLSVLDNDIAQLAPEDDPERARDILQGNGKPDYPHFAAILLQGICGPKLRVEGNSAFLFRHCLSLRSLPLRMIAQEDERFRQGHWVFLTNSVFPASDKTEGKAPLCPAVHLPEAEADRLAQWVRLSGHLNHPPNPQIDRF